MSIINFRMDTQKDVLIQDLSLISGKSVVVGAKQLRKALNAGKANYVFLARNADPALTGPFAEKCQEDNIKYAWVKSMDDLGRACGIEIGAAAAAIIG